MSKIDKVIQKLQSNPKDFTWSELKKVLSHFGYEEKLGKGSRRKFFNAQGQIIILHEPHPKKVLKSYMIELVIEHLDLKSDE